MNLQEAFDAGFDAVKAYVDRSFEEFDQRLARIEARQPERGEKGDPGEPGCDGKDGAKGDPGTDGRDGANGRDGVGLGGALIDRTGNLVVTLTDGTTRELGIVIGKDGEAGRDGRDGFSLESFDATLMDDGRTVLLSFEQGDQSFKVELGIPAMIYRGVFKDGHRYEKGDTVTWGGSLWHCDAAETSDKPDGTEKHWTLAAKRGRDGKDGVVKPEKLAQPIRVGLPAKDT